MFPPKRKLFLLILLGFSMVAVSQNRWNYISPVPGSKFINPENNIALRQGDVLSVSILKTISLHIMGEKSGVLSGKTKLSADRRTILFSPDKPFAAGECVHVHVESVPHAVNGASIPDTAFYFYVLPHPELRAQRIEEFNRRVHEPEMNMGHEELQKNVLQVQQNHLVSINDDLPDDLPPINISVFDHPAPGFILTTTDKISPWSSYLRITDNHGTPVFYRKFNSVRDFKIIPGNRLLHYYSYNFTPSTQCYLMLDDQYHVIDTLTMGNGYFVNHHDAIVMENGHKLLMAYDPQLVDMDTVIGGGSHLVTVVGFVFQELDGDENIVFQWRSWDHFEITDATYIDLTGSWIDYVHGNALEPDGDNSVLLSSRHMSEITKIDRNTGDIIWRFGPKAKNNMFSFSNDTVGFTWQHDIRRLPNGHLTLYDNGNNHVPQFSQALEYTIDETNLMATRVWNFINDPPIYGSATGSTRRIAEGHTIIDWGSIAPGVPFLSEVTAQGEKSLDMIHPNWVVCYRAEKAIWRNGMIVPDQDTLNLGMFNGGMTTETVTISNHAGHEVEISGVHHSSTAYALADTLPFTIPAQGSKNVEIVFNPTFEEGDIEDVFTFNYDSFFQDSLPQRISCQVYVKGHIENSLPPQVRFLPDSGAQCIPLNPKIDMLFSEPVFHPGGAMIQPDDVHAMISVTSDSSNGTALPFTARIDTWRRRIRISLQNLAVDRHYYISLLPGNVADADGLIQDNPQVMSFYTGDNQAPQPGFRPPDGATDISPDTVVHVVFDEQIFNVEGGPVTADDLSGMLEFRKGNQTGGPVAYTATIDDANRVISLDPAEKLEPLQDYYVAVRGEMVCDSAGNVLEDRRAAVFTTGDDTGIPEAADDINLIYPNPGHGLYTFRPEWFSVRKIEVFTLSGERVFAKTMKDDQPVALDIRPFPNGVYLVKMTIQEGREKVIKLIKN